MGSKQVWRVLLARVVDSTRALDGRRVVGVTRGVFNTCVVDRDVVNRMRVVASMSMLEISRVGTRSGTVDDVCMTFYTRVVYKRLTVEKVTEGECIAWLCPSIAVPQLAHSVMKDAQ